MASRQMKMPVKNHAEKSPEADDVFSQSQRRRPELGRYLLQVDRQTKGSYTTSNAAQRRLWQSRRVIRSFRCRIRRRRKYQHNRGSTGHAEHVTSGGGHYRAS